MEEEGLSFPGNIILSLENLKDVSLNKLQLLRKKIPYGCLQETCK